MDSTVAGTSVAVGVLAASTVFGLVHRSRTGRVRAVGGERLPARTMAAIGLADPAPVNLVQFSSEFCSGCRVVRRMCGELAETYPDLRYLDLDVAEYPAAVDALGVCSTPTLLILDAAGRTAFRCSGVPERSAMTAAIEQTATGGTR